MPIERFKPTDEQRENLERIIIEKNLVDVVVEQLGEFIARKEQETGISFNRLLPEDVEKLIAEFLEELVKVATDDELQAYLEGLGVDIQLFYNWLFYSYIGNLEE